MTSTRSAEAARAAYRRRARQRARGHRAQTQELRLERERLQLAYVMRRELLALAEGAAELARSARGSGRAAGRARSRLGARRRRAAQLVSQAQRFSLELGLDELDAQDREALELFGCLTSSTT